MSKEKPRRCSSTNSSRGAFSTAATNAWGHVCSATPASAIGVGGIRGWNTVRRDIIRHLLEDRGCIATTMVDYYGLPASGDKAWPGRASATPLAPEAKGSHVEAALLDDVANEMGDNFDRRRFVPFVVMHEFEGLLFSDCGDFARGIGNPTLASRLQAVRDQFETPEHINDSASTAPSRRVEAIIPGYVKPLLGTWRPWRSGWTRSRPPVRSSALGSSS